jgi:hypothetical protein
MAASRRYQFHQLFVGCECAGISEQRRLVIRDPGISRNHLEIRLDAAAVPVARQTSRRAGARPASSRNAHLDCGAARQSPWRISPQRRASSGRASPTAPTGSPPIRPCCSRENLSSVWGATAGRVGVDESPRRRGIASDDDGQLVATCRLLCPRACTICRLTWIGAKAER